MEKAFNRKWINEEINKNLSSEEPVLIDHHSDETEGWEIEGWELWTKGKKEGNRSKDKQTTEFHCIVVS